MGRRKKTTEEEVCKGLKRLAFGEIKDAPIFFLQMKMK